MGLTMHKSRNSFEIGRFEDICTNCALEHRTSERMNQVGKLIGKRIYKAHTPNGACVCLCEDCIKQLAKTI